MCCTMLTVMVLLFREETKAEREKDLEDKLYKAVIKAVDNSPVTSWHTWTLKLLSNSCLYAFLL